MEGQRRVQIDRGQCVAAQRRCVGCEQCLDHKPLEGCDIGQIGKFDEGRMAGKKGGEPVAIETKARVGRRGNRDERVGGGVESVVADQLPHHRKIVCQRVARCLCRGVAVDRKSPHHRR